MPDDTALVDDVAFADCLLREAGIAAVPGSVYDMPGRFRISTANANDTLAIALDRIGKATRALNQIEGTTT
jgi:aspartate aminotransferase